MLNEDSTISFLESVELASYHSSYALSIIKEIKADEDIQAGCIYQNAADILTMMGQDEAAIGYYQRAKYIKAKNYRMYTESNALTDKIWIRMIRQEWKQRIFLKSFSIRWIQQEEHY